MKHRQVLLAVTAITFIISMNSPVGAGYPDSVRKEFLAACTGLKEFKSTGASGSKIEAYCNCLLDSSEEMMSEKEFERDKAIESDINKFPLMSNLGEAARECAKKHLTENQ